MLAGVTPRNALLLSILTLLLIGTGFGQDDEEEIEYGEPKILCKLASSSIDESSGIACSRRADGVFWTHNDSGGKPRIFAFNRQGEDLGTFVVKGAKAVDWEDIASFQTDERCYLLLADIGNNKLNREEYVLYVVEEPRLSADRGSPRRKVGIHQTIRFRTEDGASNFESVAVDPEGRMIYVATKSLSPTARVYVLPFPRRDEKKIVKAKRIAEVPVLCPTAMDLSPDGRRMIVLTYGTAFEFTRSGEETWPQALAGLPRQVAMPRRPQGEALCYGGDGKSLYLTSEGKSTPLWEVPIEEW